jgi:hypothetical protein
MRYFPPPLELSNSFAPFIGAGYFAFQLTSPQSSDDKRDTEHNNSFVDAFKSDFFTSTVAVPEQEEDDGDEEDDNSNSEDAHYTGGDINSGEDINSSISRKR